MTLKTGMLTGSRVHVFSFFILFFFLSLSLVAENENLMASVEKPVIEMEYSCLLRFMVVYNI